MITLLSPRSTHSMNLEVVAGNYHEAAKNALELYILEKSYSLGDASAVTNSLRSGELFDLNGEYKNSFVFHSPLPPLETDEVDKFQALSVHHIQLIHKENGKYQAVIFYAKPIILALYYLLDYDSNENALISLIRKGDIAIDTIRNKWSCASKLDLKKHSIINEEDFYKVMFGDNLFTFLALSYQIMGYEIDDIMGN